MIINQKIMIILIVKKNFLIVLLILMAFATDVPPNLSTIIVLSIKN